MQNLIQAHLLWQYSDYTGGAKPAGSSPVVTFPFDYANCPASSEYYFCLYLHITILYRYLNLTSYIYIRKTVKWKYPYLPARFRKSSLDLHLEHCIRSVAPGLWRVNNKANVRNVNVAVLGGPWNASCGSITFKPIIDLYTPLLVAQHAMLSLRKHAGYRSGQLLEFNWNTLGYS